MLILRPESKSCDSPNYWFGAASLYNQWAMFKWILSEYWLCCAVPIFSGLEWFWLMSLHNLKTQGSACIRLVWNRQAAL